MTYLGTQPNDVKKNTGLYTPSEILQLEKDGNWGGSLELIEEQSISTAFADFTNLGNYDVHLFQLNNVVPNTNGHNVGMRFSNNGGTSYISSGYQYAYQQGNDAGSFSENKSTSDSYINLIPNTGNEATEVTNAYVYFYNLGDSSKYSFLTFHTSGMNSAGANYQMSFGGAVLPTAETHNAFQIIDGLLTRNINATASLYGIAES